MTEKTWKKYLEYDYEKGSKVIVTNVSEWLATHGVVEGGTYIYDGYGFAPIIRGEGITDDDGRVSILDNEVLTLVEENSRD